MQDAQEKSKLSYWCRGISSQTSPFKAYKFWYLAPAVGGGACKPCEGIPKSLGRVALTEQSEAGVENCMSGEKSEGKWNEVIY